jgi:alpha-glucoside transport system permease protein
MSDVTIEAGRVEHRPRTASERLTRFISKTPIHIGLGVIGLIWLVPTIGLLVTSLRPRGEIQASGWWTVFAGNISFTVDNYRQVLTAQGMDGAFMNSVFISVPATLLPLTVAALAAFAFSWIRFPFRDTMFLIIVALMMIPMQMALIPLLQLFRDIQPFGIAPMQGFLGVWMAHTAFSLPFGIFLLRNFFITLPRDLIEAARMDGAGNFQIFRQVVVPLSVPAIASYGIFQFLWVWNDLLVALIFSPQRRPMTVQIIDLLGTYGAEWHILASGAFLVMAVPLLVFFSLQRYFVQGLLAGSVK